jgi:riboflavin synthase
MFTGIILDVGEITRLKPFGQDTRIAVKTGRLSLDDQHVGNSIAVNGVCLTIVEMQNDIFEVDASGETLSCTTLGDLGEGSKVNLEPALTPTTALGGHLVSGHVDGVGEVTAIREEGRSIRFDFVVPDELARFIATKGSIAVDGVSLTVNGVDRNVFDVNIIPHTMQETIFGHYVPGSRVNLEVDIIARYLERLYSAGMNQADA